MQPQQIELVRRSWAAIEPVSETVVRVFYRRLFELAPEARGGFCQSMSSQGDRVRDALAALVRGLDPAAPAYPRAAQPDARTVAMVDAWVWALDAELGGADFQQVAEAWRAALATPAADEVHAIALGAVTA